MRKVIYGGACSLDGFLTARDGAIDWLHFSKDVQEVMARQWATVDAIVFGRKTYEFAARQGGGPTLSSVKTYLMSRTLRQPPAKDVELVSSDAGEFVRTLKSQPGKDIIVMSGGNLATSLLRARVVDEIGFNIHPVLLGAGVPAFLDAGDRIKLELIENRTLQGGCVLVLYRVK